MPSPLTHYDDPAFFYEQYWQNRNYEHLSEVTALHRLLGSRHFSRAADIGGGYGRLCQTLSHYADRVFLVEPSRKQLALAKKYLLDPHIFKLIPGTAQATGLPTASCDCLIMIRVMHHIPQPESVFVELNRILKPGGYLVLEFANSIHFKSRMISLLSGKSISLSPIERRSESNIQKQTIPFVNHHPDTVLKSLASTGFEVISTLSVSNFRSQNLKKYLPLPLLSLMEKYSQPLLSHLFFGPSIFVLARKVDKSKNP